MKDFFIAAVSYNFLNKVQSRQSRVIQVLPQTREARKKQHEREAQCTRGKTLFPSCAKNAPRRFNLAESHSGNCGTSGRYLLSFVHFILYLPILYFSILVRAHFLSLLPSIVRRSLHTQFGALYDQLRDRRFSDT